MFQKNGNFQEQIRILKNLDIMAYENKENFKSEERPTIEKAQIQLETLLVRDSHGQKFNLLCELEQFRKYGPGVYLMFKFMKFLLLVMALLLPLPLISVILLVKSEDQYKTSNFETRFEATTLNNFSDFNNLVISFNFIVLVFLTLALIIWKQNESKMVKQCVNEICLPSYFTVILKEIPNHYTEHQFKEIIQEKYGKIGEIYTAKNYHEDINKYKILYEVIEQIKEERQFYIRNKNKQSCLKLVQLFFKYRRLHQLLNEDASHLKVYEPYCAFITFENQVQREKLLSDQDQKKYLMSCFQMNSNNTQQNDFSDQKITFEACQMEPDGVAWENMDMSTKQIVFRCSIITLLFFIFLFVSLTIIFIFVAAQSGLYISTQSDMSLKEILKSNQTEALRNYCLELSFYKFHFIKKCHQFQSEYQHYSILYFIFPIVITILKMMFASIMKKMVEFRRHKNNFDKLQWQVIILSLFYFIKAGLIKFVVYRSFFFGNIQIELLQLFLPFLMKLKTFLPIYPQDIHAYNSFNGQWVAHTSHKIILIGIFSFNFTILYHFCHGLICKKIKQYKAKRMLTQRRVNQQIKGEEFQSQIIYAEIIAMLLFCFLYFSCMPIIYALTFVSLFLIYWTSKYSLINFCRKPMIYSHGIHSLAVKIILCGLLMNCLVSPIYYSQLDFDQQQPLSIFTQMVAYWGYLVLFIFISIYLTCGSSIRNLIQRLYIRLRTKINPRFKNIYFLNNLKEITKGAGKMQSYSMHQNKKYHKILELLFIVNKIEINKLGYFKTQKMESLKQIINKKDHQFKFFDELVQFLSEQCQKIQESKKEKHEDYLKILKKIQQDARKQVSEEKRSKDVQSMVKSRIKELKVNQDILTDIINANNIINFKSQIRSQLSSHMNLDLGPQTEKRLR